MYYEKHVHYINIGFVYKILKLGGKWARDSSS
jgi:hypothetical protein